MPTIIQDQLTDEQYRQLDAIVAAGGTVDYGEVYHITFPNSGIRYYAKTQWDDMPNFGFNVQTGRSSFPFQPLELMLLHSQSATDDTPVQFASLGWSFDTDDDTLQIQFIDPDPQLEMTQLFKENEEGARLDIIGVIPQINAYVRLWWGVMSTAVNWKAGVLTTSAEIGYSKNDGKLPRRYMSETSCAARFGGRCSSMAEVAENDCWYDFHLGGSRGTPDPTTNLPRTSCPQDSEATCDAVLGLVTVEERKRRPFLAFRHVEGSETVEQSKGANTVSVTNGNDGLLNSTASVIIGDRWVRNLPPLTHQIQANNSDPKRGSFSGIFPISDSSIEGAEQMSINGQLVETSADPTKNQFGLNYGKVGQAPLFLTGKQEAANYSGLAHARGLVFGDFAGMKAEQFKASLYVRGNNEIKVWSKDTTTGALSYVKTKSINRAWVFRWLLTNYRAGDGQSEISYPIEDWLPLASQCDEQVGYYDAAGAFYTGTRSTFNAQLDTRQTDQMIRDIALWGHITVPFAWQGARRAFLLGKDDLANVPVFYDGGPDSNIVANAFGGSGLDIAQIPVEKLHNKFIVWFEDAAHRNVRRPLKFEYPDLQDARGRALRDSSQKINQKEYTAYGIVDLGEAVRMSNFICDLGEFDSGGPKNNCQITFYTPYLHSAAMRSYPNGLMRMVSPVLQHYKEPDTKRSFEYFRVKNIQRVHLDNTSLLFLRIVAQAYPVDYYARLEDASQGPPMKGSPATEFPVAIDEFDMPLAA
jgi:hypothetical protein